MKKILTLIFTLIVFILSAQDTTKITYPHFLLENGKNTVVFTLEQAQKIDNDQQLLAQFKILGADINAVDSACVKVVDSQNNEIKGLKIQIVSLKELGTTKDKEIVNLKAQIAEYKIKDDLNTTELGVKESIIKENKARIRKLKWQRVAGFAGTLASSMVLIYVIIHK